MTSGAMGPGVLDALTLSTLERCDRTRSAVARGALADAVWRHGDRVALRHDCVLGAGADVLRGAQRAKRRLATSLWRCELCGKTFESEHFLDKHLARRHPATHDGGAVCLADLCGVVVPCPRAHDPPVSTALLRGEQRPQYAPNSASPCVHKREYETRRNTCVRVIQNCVMPNHDPDGQVRRYLETRLCDAALAVECGRPVPKHEKLRSGGGGVTNADVIMVFVIAMLACTYFWLRRRARRSARYRLPTIWGKKRR